MPRHVAAGTMLSYFPRRHRNVAFKILVIFAFVYLISIALDLRHSAVTQFLAPAAVKQDPEHLNIVRKPPDADIRHSKDDSEQSVFWFSSLSRWLNEPLCLSLYCATLLRVALGYSGLHSPEVQKIKMSKLE